MVGAGISASNPSALPGWFETNASIFEALCLRLESGTERSKWLAEVKPLVEAVRRAGHFPPDYQAQLIEEMCGERYFRALQALDIDVFNSGHDRVAALAQAGVVKAVVTTNFDRLIERAFEERGVPYFVAYEDHGYAEVLSRLSENGTAVAILKIHGCVSDHTSMIDTLKQRKLGREQDLRRCLDALEPAHWVFLGFSAADLETDRDYLGFIERAETGGSATYVAYPGSSKLRHGARALIGAYGKRGDTVVKQAADFLGGMCESIDIECPKAISEEEAVGPALFREGLERWADALSLSAAGLCLGAILEAVGQGEAAARVLDRLVRHETYKERGTTDHRVLQLHYGRLGAAWGRFVATRNLGGAASNASVEATQSLLRIQHSELGFAARTWLACAYLWHARGADATQLAAELISGFAGQWLSATPRTDEEAVDGWISGAQVFIVNASDTAYQAVIATWPGAFDRAVRCGDVVRKGRVAALMGLALAEMGDDAPGFLSSREFDFRETDRVCDGFALGMRSLAMGRWGVSAKRTALGDTAEDRENTARQSLDSLEKAVLSFRDQGMHPWIAYVQLQAAKAHADLNDFDNAQEFLELADEAIERFPVLDSHYYETIGQIKTMLGDETAKGHFLAALEVARKSGLEQRVKRLNKYLEASVLPGSGQ